MTWTMLVALTMGNQFCGVWIPYGSLERCERELPAVIRKLGPDAKAECMLAPVQFRPVCLRRRPGDNKTVEERAKGHD